jgi:hypothetical protein
LAERPAVSVIQEPCPRSSTISHSSAILKFLPGLHTKSDSAQQKAWDRRSGDDLRACSAGDLLPRFRSHHQQSAHCWAGIRLAMREATEVRRRELSHF